MSPSLEWSVPAMTETPERTSWDRGALAAPVLLGAMGGALVAGRFETGIACVSIGLAGACFVAAPWPKRQWFVAIGGGVLAAVLLNLYLNPGSPLHGPRILGRVPSWEGLLRGGLLSLRLLGASVALHGLRSAWPGERALDEFARLMRPLERVGVPVGRMRATVGLALRFVPLLVTESQRIHRIQEARAGRPAHGWSERLTRLRAAAIPTLVAALERADRVALALEARHYRMRPISGGAPIGLPGRLFAWALFGTALLWR